MSTTGFKYCPINMKALPGAMPQAPEPGRTEARLSEFYRRLSQKRGGPVISAAPTVRQRTRSTRSTVRVRCARH